ncbi:MAG TPA: DUF3575 domain-containing protein [Puia sp.]|jgi:hypothetical protein|nr:DUF3575 domain-containing protein [Puia sp.]
MKELIGKLFHINFRLFIATVLFLLISYYSFGQMKDTTLKGKINYPNIIKLSVSSWLLYPNSFHMGYERILNPNHSIYVFGGYNQFPLKLDLNLSNTNLTDSRNKNGYSIGAEFRFYLPKENKYEAPHGIYLAPYLSYYDFSANNTLTHTDSSGSQSANLSTRIDLLNIGFELGYQFVIAKRFIVDAEMFGPSFTYYTFKANINGELDGQTQNETLQAVLDALKAKFPLLSDLSSSRSVYSSGSASQKFPAIGFRYAVSIGFMF